MADERVIYLMKGTLVGLSAGFIVSLFRLGIEFIFQCRIFLVDLFQGKLGRFI